MSELAAVSALNECVATCAVRVVHSDADVTYLDPSGCAVHFHDILGSVDLNFDSLAWCTVPLEPICMDAVGVNVIEIGY